MKKRLLFHLVALIFTLFFFMLQFVSPTIIREQIESKTFDFRLRFRNLVKPQPTLEDIVIVTVDEKSIKEIGRWPWRRDVMAGLINEISEHKPKVIGIDIMFTEEESKERDDKLAAAFQKAGNVVLATPFFVPKGQKKNIAAVDIPDFLWDAAFMQVKSQEGINWKENAIKAESVNPPLEKFSKVTTLGHVYTLPDMDGVTRWEILSLNYGDDCFPAFALQIARIALGLEMNNMVLYGGAGVKLGERFIKTDLSGRVLINYVGKEHSFHYESASDVIKGKVPPEHFKDKIVFIGTSALATYDQKTTPFSANMPGVEKNATVVQNIIKQDFLIPSPGVMELVVIIFTGIALGLILPRFKSIASSVIAIGTIIIYVFLSYYLLIYRGLWINLLYPVANMFSIFAVQTVIRFFSEEKKAREIRKMFSSYVSPKIVKELIDNPDKAKLGGERKVVTVLFSDVIGFTSLSERRQPEEVVSLLNEYLQEMTEIIFKWDGTLDKFVGDEIMAFWGAPLDQPKHAELAIRCAINMSDRLNELHEQWRQRGKDILDCGIGINTGEVLIGNIGAQGKKMDYTLIGDHVNLAARVEKLTRQYNTRILITENTFQGIEPVIRAGLFGHYELSELETVKVKGKEQGIKLLGLKGLKQA
ncbi:MAG: adenylate/guanylate cyclase domain-containing protein [Nitrospirae bacterium]|nr:adenylate/guanylate cyclase domain-containing protein [Nitrospirota bacterium]